MELPFTIEDPRGRRVICTVEQWTQHVLVSHRYMAGREQEIARCIQAPHFGIYRDSKRANRSIYYSRNSRGVERYLKVVVEFDENNAGFLITAFLTTNMKPGEVLEWPD